MIEVDTHSYSRIDKSLKRFCVIPERDSLSAEVLEFQNDELEGQFISFLSNRQYGFYSAEKS